MKCALPECSNLVTNYRTVCCCLSHQRRYGGLRAKGLVPAVDKPKIEPIKRGLGRTPAKKYKDWNYEKKGAWISYLVERRKKRDKSMPSWQTKTKSKNFISKQKN